MSPAVSKKVKKFNQLCKNNKRTLRNSDYMTFFRQSVIARDNHTCQRCGSTSRPEAHHMFPYENFEEYRLNIDSGITLCHNCHTEYHQKYDADNSVNPDTLWEFINAPIPTHKYSVQLSTVLDIEAENKSQLMSIIDDILKEMNMEDFEWNYEIKATEQ